MAFNQWTPSKRTTQDVQKELYIENSTVGIKSFLRGYELHLYIKYTLSMSVSKPMLILHGCIFADFRFLINFLVILSI